MMYLILAVVIAALACAGLCWALCRAASLPTPAGPPTARVRAKRQYVRSICPYCGEMDIPVRRDGEPVARWHRCVPALAGANIPTGSDSQHAWPPAPDTTSAPAPATNTPTVMGVWPHATTALPGTWPPAPKEE
jgi:hypothetical protein